MGKSSDHRIEKIFDVAQFYLLVITTRGHQFYLEQLDQVWERVLMELELFQTFFFQAEDGIRDLVRSRGLGDVYKRQLPYLTKLFKIKSMLPSHCH